VCVFVCLCVCVCAFVCDEVRLPLGRLREKIIGTYLDSVLAPGLDMPVR
jgi:hypothetical protein